METTRTTAKTLPTTESLGAIGLSAISTAAARGHQWLDLVCLEVSEFNPPIQSDDYRAAAD